MAGWASIPKPSSPLLTTWPVMTVFLIGVLVGTLFNEIVITTPIIGTHWFALPIRRASQCFILSWRVTRYVAAISSLH